MTHRRKITLALVVPLFLLILVQIIRDPYFRPILSPEYWEILGKTGQVLRIVHANYVEEDQASFEDLANEALDSMVSTLDKYSHYLPPEQYENYKKFNRMEYVGIGVQVQEIEDRVHVIEVFGSGSAAEQGILPGDQILSADGKDVEGMSLGQVVGIIKGPKGTTVGVRVKRNYPEAGTHSFEVERRDIIRESVTNVQILPPDTGYLHIAKFTDNTPYLLAQALEDLQGQGATSLVMDLRGNPGGLLKVCVEVASEFLDDNQLVLSVRSRENKEGELHKAKADGRKLELPIVILQDGMSASASEILSGCLQSYDLAKVVGTQSHGKGTVQTVYNLKGDAGMVLTTAKYYLPDDRTVAGEGVTPDYIVEAPEDNQSLVRLSLMRRSDLTPEQFKETYGVEPVPDPQLDVALQLLREGTLPEEGTGLDGESQEPQETSSVSPSSGNIPSP